MVNSLILTPPHLSPHCLLISVPLLNILNGNLFTSPFPVFFSFLHREMNVRKHSKPESVPLLTEKEKHVVTVVK